MNKNEALIELCRVLARDRGVLAQLNWQKVVLRCQADERSMSMGGFSYDAQGDVLPVAPKDVQVDMAFWKFRKIMQIEEQQEKAWVVCLLRFNCHDVVDLDFEYKDARRWEINFRNRDARIREFDAMPILGLYR